MRLSVSVLDYSLVEALSRFYVTGETTGSAFDNSFANYCSVVVSGFFINSLLNDSKSLCSF